MTTSYVINVRYFPVTIRDERTGAKIQDAICFSKDQLRAADAAGIGTKELIWKIYNKKGYKVLDIAPAEKRVISMDLLELYRLHERTNVGVKDQVII